MNILSVENISKHFNEKDLFHHISFGIDASDKIGLIGVNGTGKTTLLKVLVGMEPADEGRVVVGSDIDVEYLAQNPDFDDTATVLQQVFKGNSPLMQLLREYEETLDRLNRHPEDAGLQNRLMRLNHQMDAQGVWQLESEAKAILTTLGITDFSAVVGDLSGGQRKRIALAGALITPADLLILDEPTNQIDHETVEWLEDYLNKRKGALIMVTHDRYFLDRVTNRIIELDHGHLYTYSGNYTAFLQKKAEREELAQAAELKRRNILRNELAWIQRGAQARTTKQKARIERFERLAEEKSELHADKLEISVGSTRLGKKVIELEQVTKSFGSGAVIKDFSYIILRDERTGIVGPNGSGKTTLLNLIAGRLQPDAGKIDVGKTVKIGYFSQETTEMDDDQRVIDYIKEGAEILQTAEGGMITASQMLERFLFPPAAQWNFVGNLSGGEKRRLYLLRILMSAPNVLLLDEPTNDLDIETLTILEDYLDEFMGALIVVSHDRYFLNRVVGKILAFEGDGAIWAYHGDYSGYLEKVAARQAEAAAREPKRIVETKPEISVSGGKKPVKLSFKEMKEFETIDARIAELETELTAVNDGINAAGSDFARLQALVVRQQELEEQLETALERWMYLHEIAGETAKNK